MYLVDANILVYAADAGSEHHDAAREWLDEQTGGLPRSVGLPWPSLLRCRAGLRCRRRRRWPGSGSVSHYPDTPPHMWRQSRISGVVLPYFVPGLAPQVAEPIAR